MKTIKIGEKLRALRKSQGLTTNELANKVNVSQSYISRFENNRAIPDIDMLQRILTALNTDLASFFSTEMTLSEDMIHLLDTLKTMSPEAREKLNEFLKLIKKENNHTK